MPFSMWISNSFVQMLVIVVDVLPITEVYSYSQKDDRELAASLDMIRELCQSLGSGSESLLHIDLDRGVLSKLPRVGVLFSFGSDHFRDEWPTVESHREER